MIEDQYDYIIVGGGCSGLSFALKLLQSGLLSEKRCLILDSRDSYKNDKTWCGWHIHDTGFESCVTKRWYQWHVCDKDQIARHNTTEHPYQYIPADKYYQFCLDIISQTNKIELKLNTPVLHIQNGCVATSTMQWRAPLIIDAREPKNIQQVTGNYLFQCFYGWKIQTKEDCFDPTSVTLMDFPAVQTNGINFMYVLPFSKRVALIEPTYFLHHKQIPGRSHFRKLMTDYMLEKYQCSSFEVLHEESGVLPMVDKKLRMKQSDQDKILYIGSGHNLLRPGTGYAFYGIQRHNQKIIDALATSGKLPVQPYRFFTTWMDDILLRVCRYNPTQAASIFFRLFSHTKGDQLAHFMQDNANIYDYLKIILGVPKQPFIRETFKSLTEKMSR